MLITPNNPVILRLVQVASHGSFTPQVMRLKRSLVLLVVYFSALVYSVPLVWHAINTNSMPLEIANDTTFYLTRVQVWRTTLGMPINPYHEFTFTQPATFTFLVESTLALIAHGLRVSTNLIYGIATFFSFIVNFQLMQVLIRKVKLNEISGLIIFFASYTVLVEYAPYRPVSPQINFTLYLLTCIVIAAHIDLNQIRLFSKKLVILQCLLWFVYPYYALLTAITLFLHSISSKHLDFLGKIFNLVTYVLVPVLPWLFVSFSLDTTVTRETALRTGLVESNHFPGAIRILILALALIILVFLYQRKTHSSFSSNRFLWIHGFAIIAASNSQIFTGKSLQFESHFILPFYLVFLSIIMLLYEKAFWNKSVIFVILIVLFFGSFLKMASYSNKAWHQVNVAINAKEDPILDFLRTHVAENQLVSAPLELSEKIVFILNRRVLASGSSKLYFMSDEELRKRVLVNYFPEELEKPFPIDMYLSMFGLRYRDAIAKNSAAAAFLPLAKSHTEKLFVLEQNEIRRVESTYASLDIAVELDNFNVDWIVRKKGDLRWFAKASSNCNSSKTTVGSWRVCKW